jgi:hypothetical protein
MSRDTVIAVMMHCFHSAYELCSWKQTQSLVQYRNNPLRAFLELHDYGQGMRQREGEREVDILLVFDITRP